MKASISLGMGMGMGMGIDELCISQFQAWPSPRQNPRAIFLMGEFPTPRAKSSKPPPPGL